MPERYACTGVEHATSTDTDAPCCKSVTMRPPTLHCVSLLLLSSLLETTGQTGLPQGFNISTYARVPNVRRLAVSEATTGPLLVYAGTSSAGQVYVLADWNRDSRVDRVFPLLSGLDAPSGVAWWRNTLYVSGFSSGRGVIWRLSNADTYARRNRTISRTLLRVVTNQLPSNRTHGTRYLRFGPDGQLYFGIGSPCPDPCNSRTSPQGLEYSSLYRLNVTSGALIVMARGVRNTVGLDWHPRTGQLWFTDAGRDGLGDNQPDDELNVLTRVGEHFGFPWCHTLGQGPPAARTLGAQALADPQLNLGGVTFTCSSATLAAQPMGPHVTPLGMTFYRPPPGNPASLFPAQYHNHIFVAQRGSWNRAARIGYRLGVVGLNQAGTGVVSYNTFVTWLDDASQNFTSRPVDVAQLPDGSLLVSSDAMGTTSRITYTAPPTARAPTARASRRRSRDQRSRSAPTAPRSSVVGPAPDLVAARGL